MAGNAMLYRAFEMKAMVYSHDSLFIPTMRRVLKGLGLARSETASYEEALSRLVNEKLDAVVMDWQEIPNLGEFLQCLRSSKMNKDVVQVAIARDLLDLRQAFSAGIQFLIHKPPSVVQISRCLEAVQVAVLRQRRKSHREPVRIPAVIAVRDIRLQGATIVNISNEGLGVVLNGRGCAITAQLTTGTEVEFAFTLPETSTLVRGSGIIVWINREGAAGLQFKDGNAGLQFQYLSRPDQSTLEQWVGMRFERELSRLLTACRADSA